MFHDDGQFRNRTGAECFALGEDEGVFSDYVDRPLDFEMFFSFFPEFNPEGVAEDETAVYDLAFLSAAAKEAAVFCRPTNCRELDGPDKIYAFYLNVAHLAVLNKRQQTGLTGTATPGSGVTAGMDTMPGVMTSASVGGVSVTKTGITQPKNFWEEWYYQTPYGRKFLAFLEGKVAAGFYYEGEENIGMLLRE